MENNKISIAKALPGSRFAYWFSDPISVTAWPSFSMLRINANVPMFIVT